jgi:hypothetical protein
MAFASRSDGLPAGGLKVRLTVVIQLTRGIRVIHQTDLITWNRKSSEIIEAGTPELRYGVEHRNGNECERLFTDQIKSHKPSFRFVAQGGEIQ